MCEQRTKGNTFVHKTLWPAALNGYKHPIVIFHGGGLARDADASEHSDMILKNISIILALAVMTSGCGFDIALPKVAPTARAQQTSVPIGDGLMNVRAPQGYCAHRNLGEQKPQEGIVIFEKCRSLFGIGGAGAHDAVLSYSAHLSGVFEDAFDEEAFEAFFASEAGRAALARDGKPSSVDVLDIRHEADRVILHARDRSSGAMEGMANDYWRIVTVQNSRLVTMSVTARDGAQMNDADLTELLGQFAALQGLSA